MLHGLEKWQLNKLGSSPKKILDMLSSEQTPPEQTHPPRPFSLSSWRMNELQQKLARARARTESSSGSLSDPIPANQLGGKGSPVPVGFDPLTSTSSHLFFICWQKKQQINGY